LDWNEMSQVDLSEFCMRISTNMVETVLLKGKNDIFHQFIENCCKVVTLVYYE